MASPTIAPEIKNATGYRNADELRRDMPENPDAPTALGDVAAKPRRKRGPRVAGATTPRPTPAVDPFANDKRYQEACAEMAAFGGKGIIVRGFDAGARVLEDEKFKLDAAELRTWDNFFYVLSKKPMFDVGHPIFLALFFVITLFCQLGWRVIERSESTFITDLFRPKDKDEPTPTAEG